MQKSLSMNTPRAHHYLNLCLGIYLGFLMSIAIVISVVKTNVDMSPKMLQQFDRGIGSESRFVDSVCAEDVTRVEEIKAWRGTNARDMPKQQLTDILYRVVHLVEDLLLALQ